MSTPGRLALEFKIDRLPDDAKLVNGKMTFTIAADGRVFYFTVKQKTYSRLTEAAKVWANWGASIKGRLGPPHSGGFAVEDAGVATYEKKPKATAAEAATEPAKPSAPTPIRPTAPPRPAPPRPTPTPRPAQPIVEYKTRGRDVADVMRAATSRRLLGL